MDYNLRVDRATRVRERNKSCGSHHVLIPYLLLVSSFFPNRAMCLSLSDCPGFPLAATSFSSRRHPRPSPPLRLLMQPRPARPGSSNYAVRPQPAIARGREIQPDAARRRCGGVRHRFYGGAAAARGRRLCKRSTLLQ
jgi:hypothetical protein